jgi:hypothetical protein
MSILEFVLGFPVGIALVSLGWWLGYRANSKRYWDGYSRGYATAEADLNGLNGTVVRVEE